MNVKARQSIEKRIVYKLVTDILDAGYRIGVSLERGYDIEDMLIGSKNKAKILRAAFDGDECHLFVQYPDGPTTENGVLLSKGWVYLVFGNDGYDVICDYSVKLESLIEGANKLANKLEGLCSLPR